MSTCMGVTRVWQYSLTILKFMGETAHSGIPRGNEDLLTHPFRECRSGNARTAVARAPCAGEGCRRPLLHPGPGHNCAVNEDRPPAGMLENSSCSVFRDLRHQLYMFTYHDCVHPDMRLLSEKPICLEPCIDYRSRMGSSFKRRSVRSLKIPYLIVVYCLTGDLDSTDRT